MFIKAFNGDLLASIEDKVYKLKELNRNATYSKEIDPICDKPKTEIKKIIPQPDHPWRLKQFRQHVKDCYELKNMHKKN